MLRETGVPDAYQGVRVPPAHLTAKAAVPAETHQQPVPEDREMLMHPSGPLPPGKITAEEAAFPTAARNMTVRTGIKMEKAVL